MNKFRNSTQVPPSTLPLQAVQALFVVATFTPALDELVIDCLKWDEERKLLVYADAFAIIDTTEFGLINDVGEFEPWGVRPLVKDPDFNQSRLLCLAPGTVTGFQLVIPQMTQGTRTLTGASILPSITKIQNQG